MSMFKGFQKVHEDDKTTIMRHPDTKHEIKIAHAQLSQKLKNELKKLPLHKAKGGPVSKMEGGGFPSEADMAAGNYTGDYSINLPANASVSQQNAAQNVTQNTYSSDSDSSYSSDSSSSDSFGSDPNNLSSEEVQLLQNMPQQNQAPSSTVTTAQNAPQTQAAPESEENEEAEDQTPVVAPKQTSTPTIEPQPTGQPAPIADIQMQNHMNELANTEADIASKQIQPQTLSSMFANASTLGKIGTIMGMVIGSAGSGLSKQPNLLMTLMQQQMDRDLDAQKANVTNARSFLSLNYQHQKQLAEIHQMDVNNAYTTEMTRALAAKFPEEVNLLKQQQGLTAEQTNNIHQEALGKAQLNAKNQMTASAYYDLLEKSQNNPQAMRGLAMMYPQIQAAAKNNTLQMLAQKNYTDAMSGNSGAPMDSGLIDYPRMNQLQILGVQKMPGGMSTEDVSNATKEASSVEQNQALRAEWSQSFNQLSNMTLNGQLSPNQRAAYVTMMAGKIQRQSEGRFNENQAHDIADAMFPGPTDLGQDTINVKRQQGNAYFDAINAATPTLKRFGLKRQLQTAAPQMSQDQQALQWARSNPNDPRSAQILQKLGQH